jgi:arabinofuranan 3-O-arabinosyltransferase
VVGKGGGLISCGTVSLTAGEHRFSTQEGWLTDVVRFASTGSPAPAKEPAPAPAQLDIKVDTDTELAVHASAADEPYVFMTGRGYDRRWVATIDGKPLGEPALVDGYAVGWRIDEPGEHDIVVRFFPQRPTDFGLLFGVGALVVCIALAVVGNRFRGRFRRPRSAASDAS